MDQEEEGPLDVHVVVDDQEVGRMVDRTSVLLEGFQIRQQSYFPHPWFRIQ